MGDCPAGFSINQTANRAVAEEQPRPVERQNIKDAKLRWKCDALVAKKQTGKATGWTREVRSLYGSTETTAVEARAQFLHEYMHPRARARPSSSSTRTDVDTVDNAGRRPKRQAAPETLREPKYNTAPKRQRPGPGRGYKYVAARPLLEQIREALILPPADAEEVGNWFQRMQVKDKWRSERMRQLEAQVEQLLVINSQQATTIKDLRSRVAELEESHNRVAQEILSYVRSRPVQSEACHSKMLEEKPEWANVLSLGYTNAQKKNLIYQHLKRLVAELQRVTGGDAMKAKQLADLLHLRVHAGEHRDRSAAHRQEVHENDVNKAIVGSIYWFVQALHDAGGKGRYPHKIRQAQQVIATAVSKAVALSSTPTSAIEIGEKLGLSPNLILKCRKRYDSLTDGEFEQIFDSRAEGGTALNSEWKEFAQEFWTDPEATDEHGNALNFVRRSERTADEIRDPSNRKSGERYRIMWLEEKVSVMFETVVRMGKALFGEKFHISWPYFLDLRPFYVKDATRVTCMCVYHLRWREYADELINYRNALRNQKVSNCSCTITKNEKQLRKQLICPSNQAGGHGASLDNVDCMLQRCPECRDLKKLTSGPGSLCAEEMRDPGGGQEALEVHYESYEKIGYRTKDGTEKVKKDFVSKSVAAFLKSLSEYWPKFIAHHNDAKWHDNDFTAMKKYLPRGKVAIVIDYAENYSHKPRFEHQSKYFSQVQTTIIPVVVMFRLEDLTNITKEERAVLLRLFDELNLPRVISETHFMISSDMVHDNAMIQKVMDDLLLPYVTTHATAITEVHIRSDGCNAQFKCAANFYWVSQQSKAGCGLFVNWSFFESCHGKCLCDPEGGALKNAARNHELHISDQAEQLKDSEAFYKWAQHKSGLHRPKLSLAQKKGRGVFRRFFYWIPSKGIGAVDRSRLPQLTAEGTSRLHEFVDIGVVGTVSTRRASCHQCQPCWSGAREHCENAFYTGTAKELKITKKQVPQAAAARIDRATLNREAVARAERAAEGSIVCIETHKDEQSYPWCIGTVVKRMCDAPAASLPYDSSKDSVHFEPLRAGEPALQVTMYEALQPGSSTYTLSDLTMWVPARRVRVIDLQLHETRESRLNNSRRRFKIEESSLRQIHVAMPTTNDSWVVDKVLQYSCIYGVEQWLIKWKEFADDHNTWEPWDNLATDQVQGEAVDVREVALKEAPDVSKFTMVTLHAVLAARGKDILGQKAELVQRVSDLLSL